MSKTIYHRHHIVPKHMGGDDSPDNITPPISIPLHAALHKDLYEALGHQEDLWAWKYLEGLPTEGIVHSEEMKRKQSLGLKGNKNGLGSKHPHTEAHKRKISENHHNVSNINNPMYGRKHSEETKAKMRKAKENYIPWNKGKRYILGKRLP